jgi:hypothetical protein
MFILIDERMTIVLLPPPERKARWTVASKALSSSNVKTEELSRVHTQDESEILGLKQGSITARCCNT